MSHTPEDDRTVLSTGGAQAPAMPYPHAQYLGRREHALPAGTRLGEFEITDVLGEGGFGIVYLAYDNSLDRQVALKEYMPSFADRSTGAHVSVRSADNKDSFEAGLRSFINEARLLAQFDHPSLVKVYRFWEANGTAYMVMPYYRGITLKQTLKEHTSAPDEAWLKSLLAPLLDALDVIHQHQCYHRDIAPDNILMLEEGRPLLLDFGAARRAINGINQAFTVILKQNYAPIEQYAEMPGMSQGPWTDLYALASVVHFAIDGHAPPPAVGRMITDPYVPLATRHADAYSPAFLAAIDRALAFKPEDRPQSVAAMRSLLDIGKPVAREPAASTTPPVASAQEGIAPVPLPASPVKASRRGRSFPLAALSVVILGGAGWFAYTTMSTRGPASPQQPAQTAPTPSLAFPSQSALPAQPLPFTPVGALDGILAGASPGRKVEVQAPSQHVLINRDNISFSIRSAHAGHVYVYMVGTRGNDFHLLFPNAIDRNNRISAGETLRLPRPTWPIKAVGPAGVNHFVVMVSDVPRDFGAAGVAEEEAFFVFPLERAAALQRAYTGSAPLFAGVPICQEQPCSAAYGAAAFKIEETEE